MLRTTSRFIPLFALALLFSAPLAAQQYARPDSTISGGTFSPVGAATLHEAIDEVTANDGDYIDTGTGNSTTASFTLSDVSDPGTYANNHIIRWRCRATVGSKPKGGETCDVALYQGTTQIATSNNNAASRGAFGTNTLTIADASAITDYSALELHFTTAVDADESIQISWAELEVPGQAAVAPTVDTPTWADVTDTTATLGGRVFADGGATVTARGVEWGTSDGGPYPNSVPHASGGLGTFTVPVTGLPASTPIFFRAWATNTGGTGYSAQDTFTTNAPASPPTVEASAATSVTATSATLNGDVTADGGATVTDRGFEWGTTSTTPGNYDNSQSAGSGGLGIFNLPIGSLAGNTRYYFRAWATNTGGTGSSSELFFDTPVAPPTLGPPTKANVAATSADLGGEVTDTGGGTVSACGVYWDTATPPETAGTQVPMGPCDQPFSQTVTGLPGGQLVYFRAYATNEAGTAYSTIDSFTPGEPPTLAPDPTVANITHQSADLGGNITSDGGLPLTERGTVWAIDPAVPDINSNRKTEGGTTAGAFSHTRTLPAGTTINFKAYAINSLGTTLTANTGQFTTGTEPTVQASNITFNKTAARGMQIRWTRGNGEGSIVVVRTTGSGRVDPVDGVSYAANHSFPDAQDIGGGNFVVYVGPNRYVNVGLMTQNTSYTVAIYEYTSSSGTWDYLQANPAEAVNSTTDEPVHNTDVGAECGDCHDAHTAFLPHDTEQKAVCETCHNATGTGKLKLEFDLHLTPNKNPDLTFVDCGYCHELHNPGVDNTTWAYNQLTLTSDYNKAYLRANVDKYVSTATTDDAFLQNDTYDAGAPENANTPERAVEGGDDTTARGYCQVCHSYTKYHRSSFTTVADRPNPGDPLPNQCHDGEGRVGGPGECTSGAPETHCGKCHQHNNRFIGVGGSQTCDECHASGIGSRRAIMPEFDRLSTHIPGGSAVTTQADCQVCHDGAHSGFVTVKNADTGVVYTPPAETDPAWEEAFEPHCMSCHDDGVASDLPASGADQTQTSPFIGSGPPPVIGSAWSTAGHRRDAGTFPSSPVSCVGDGTSGCHGSGHGSENLDLLAPAAGPTQTKTDFCIACHDSDGPSSKDLAAVFLTPPNTQLQTTSASKAPVNQRHDISTADQTYSGASLTCANCHNPHADNTASPVHDPDLATPTPLGNYAINNAYTDDGYNFTYNSGGNLDPVNPEGTAGGRTELDYIPFCLTCHDGNPPAGVVMNSNMENLADAWAGADKHGRGNNAGTDGSTNKGGMKFPWVTSAADGQNWDPSAPYAALNCTQCHGAHGSGNIFNLRTSINVGGVDMEVGGVANMPVPARISDPKVYTLPFMDGKNVNEATGVQSDHYWGAWCSFCHKMDGHPGKVESDSCTGGHMHNGGAF